MNRLPDCHSRRVIDESSRTYFCAHPRVHARGQLVTAEMCSICDLRKQPPPEEFRPFPPRRTKGPNEPCFYLGDQTGSTECRSCRGSVKLKTFHCRHPLHGEVTIRDCNSCSDFEPLLGRCNVGKWAVGMTTARRTEPTIDRCLQSATDAGWGDVHIFAEPGSIVPNRPGVKVTRRGETLGVINNWFLGLSELVHRVPEADAYVMLQDDVIFAKNIRQFLESHLWPGERVGLVSVYCPEPYASGKRVFHTVNPRDGLLGALCFILPGAIARWILTAGMASLLRQRGFVREARHLDVFIGNILNQSEWPIYYFSPSLASHIGRNSTLWPGIADNRRRRAGEFVGEEFDAREIHICHETNPL